MNRPNKPLYERSYERMEAYSGLLAMRLLPITGTLVPVILVPGMYQLAECLCEEAKLVQLTMKTMSDQKVAIHQQRTKSAHQCQNRTVL